MSELFSPDWMAGFASNWNTDPELGAALAGHRLRFQRGVRLPG